MKEIYINPFTDFGFKKLFGEDANKRLLIDFLNSLLPEHHQIADLHYTDSEQLGRTATDRKAIFDLACTSTGGERFIVEMQKAKQNYFKDRSLFYATFPIQEQAKKGDWDYSLSAVYTIAILDFEFDEDRKKGTREAIHRVHLKNQSNEVFSDKFNFIYITLPNFTKTEAQLATHQDKWIYAFKHLARLEDIPRALQDAIFLEFFEAARIIKLNNADYAIYHESLKAYWDWNAIYSSGVEEARAEGEAKGREEGELNSKLAIAGNLLDILDDATIAGKTGLTLEQVNQLRLNCVR
jgi:predicted transposase/invertase (TIGR01784 family)